MTQKTPFLQGRPSGTVQHLLLAGSALILLVMAVIDAQFKTFNPSIASPTLMVVCWWIGNRRSVWILAALSILLTMGAGFWEGSDTRAWVHRLMMLGSIATAAFAL